MVDIPDVVSQMVPPLLKGKEREDAVSITIEGKAFHGWKQVSVTKHLESICNEFSITLDDKFEGLNTQWPLKPDIPIQIAIGTERVFTGNIELAEPEFSPESRSFTISGRSNAGDLVDCTHEAESELLNVRLDKLAETLCAPFGIKIFLSVTPTETISKFAVKPGETVFEALDRAARLQGFFWIATRGGHIRLTRAARARSFSKLQQDVNMLAGSAVYDGTKRFSKYTVKGQAGGLPDFSGANASQPVGSATDNGAQRYRPLTIIAEGSVDSAKAKKRAEWEASTRLAQMARIEVQTDSWTQEDGSLWGLNQVVRVKSPFLGLDRDLLTATVRHTKSSDGGTVTDMTLVDPNAYNPSPIVNKKDSDDMFANLGPADQFSLESKLTKIGGVDFL